MEDAVESSSLTSRRADVAIGLALTGAVLVIGVAGLTWLAQRAHQDWFLAAGIPAQMYSLPLHAIAMTGIGLVAVATASFLVVTGRLAMAAPVLLGAVAGPMTLIAVPVSTSLTYQDGRDTVFGWHLLVGGVTFAVLATGTWWMSRHLGSVGVLPDPSAPGRRRPLMSGTALYILVTGVSLAAQVPMMKIANPPQPVVMLGWSLLVGGGAVAGMSLSARQLTVATMGVGAVLLLMAIAYLRIGGWPGVAGWELHAKPPIILTWVAAAAFAAGPLIGFLTSLIRLPALRPSLELPHTER